MLYTQVALCPSMAARTRSIWISVNAHELNELQTPSAALDASHCSCSTSPTRTGTTVANVEYSVIAIRRIILRSMTTPKT